MKKNVKMMVVFMVVTVMMFSLVACGTKSDSDTTVATTESVVDTTDENTTKEDIVNGNDKGDSDTEEVTTETTTETEVEKKYRKAGVFENSDGSIKTYAYESLDGTYSDNIVVFDDGTHKVNFTIASSSDIGAIAGVKENRFFITNSSNTIAIKYFWDEEPGEIRDDPSDDPDYVRCVSNGQFKYYYTDTDDLGTINQWFIEIEILDDATAQERIDEYNHATEGYTE